MTNILITKGEITVSKCLQQAGDSCLIIQEGDFKDKILTVVGYIDKSLSIWITIPEFTQISPSDVKDLECVALPQLIITI